jgi:hypothetical protein
MSIRKDLHMHEFDFLALWITLVSILLLGVFQLDLKC